MRPLFHAAILVAMFGLCLPGHALAQDSVSGAFEGRSTYLRSTRLDAESGIIVRVPIDQVALRTDRGIRRYPCETHLRVTSPDHSEKVRRGDPVELVFMNGRVAEIRVLRLVGVVRIVETSKEESERQFGQATGHREATYISLKSNNWQRWELAGDVKITNADGSPAEAARAGDTVELTFRNDEVSEIKITRSSTAIKRVRKLTGIITQLDTKDVSTETRQDLVPSRQRTYGSENSPPSHFGAGYNPKVIRSRDMTYITLKDKGRWEVSSLAKLLGTDGKPAPGVHEGDEVELTLNGPDVVQIVLLKTKSPSISARLSTQVTGIVDRVETRTVPVEMRNGQVLKSKDVTEVVLRDTGTPWELTSSTKILTSNGKPTDGVHADDDVELHLSGRYVTEVRIRNR